MNSCKRAEPVFWFCLHLYYTGNFIPVNAVRLKSPLQIPADKRSSK